MASEKEEPRVLTKISGPIAVHTLNRPEKHNASDKAMTDAVEKMIFETVDNPDVRVSIITGAGKSFMAGGDMNRMRKMSPLDGRAHCLRGQRYTRAMENSAQVWIAAINGAALGGGMELSLACDFRIATPNAIMGLPEPRVGVLAGIGGISRLIRTIPRAYALDMLLTGKRIDAARALEIGLINSIAEREDLMDRAMALAEDVIQCAPVAIDFIKSCVSWGQGLDIDMAQKLEADMWGILCSTEDRDEGMAAFLEKRPANFKGR